MITVHTPVLREPVVSYLSPSRPDALVLDGTLGEGGHSCLFLEKFPQSMVVGIDADAVMGDRALERLKVYGRRFEYRLGWTDAIISQWSGRLPDVILMDLGISTYHYKNRNLGFSFSSSQPLDMRLDNTSGESAADLVNGMAQDDLANLIFEYGQERYSRRIARKIVQSRQHHRIEDSLELADIVSQCMPPQSRRGRIHPATRTFQALRIAVNRELERLAAFLEQAPGRLAPGGKLGVISFHSLEDRLVKHCFRANDRRYGGSFDVLTRRPVMADEMESRDNPSSRSARFRVLQRPVESNSSKEGPL